MSAEDSADRTTRPYRRKAGPADFADPMVAMFEVWLERSAERNEQPEAA